jgi:uncharacterized protein YbjT (DUF2867 family)
MSANGNTVLLAGATGGTGRRTLECLSRTPYRVRALTRSAGNRERLRRRGADEVVVGDLLDPNDAARVAEGVDAVISCVGSTPWEALRGDEDDLVDGRGNAQLLDAAVAAGASRFVMESSLGVGDDRGSWMARLFRATIPTVLRAKDRAESAIRDSGVAYTILRPGVLAGGSESDDVQVAEAGTGLWGAVSRADVARLLVASLSTPRAENRILEVVRNPLLRRRAEAVDWTRP